MAVDGAVEVLLLQVFVIFAAAKLFGALVTRLRGPGVVGEILAGVVLGTAVLRGPLQLDATMEVLHFLAEVGVVFLLFAVGLETPLHELTRVGRTASAVAVAGVVTPLAAGIALGYLLGEGTAESIFLGVALVATSVGITAKVLADQGVLDSAPARVILGAAVIDDVLGLIILAIAKGLAIGGTLHLADVGVVILMALGFVAAAMVLGPKLVRAAARSRLFPERADEAARTRATVAAIAVGLGLSALASTLGLAALVGAFFAGMAFAEIRERYQLEHAIQPIVLFLTPVFFAFIGLQLDLGAAWAALGIALVVTLVAVLTKLLPCALAARSLGRQRALAVGAGMVPRGEVGIVVALVGLSAGVVSDQLYAVVVTMALLTTVLGPPMLNRLLRGEAAARGPAATEAAQG